MHFKNISDKYIFSPFSYIAKIYQINKFAIYFFHMEQCDASQHSHWLADVAELAISVLLQAC